MKLQSKNNTEKNRHLQLSGMFLTAIQQLQHRLQDFYLNTNNLFQIHITQRECPKAIL